MTPKPVILTADELTLLRARHIAPHVARILANPAYEVDGLKYSHSDWGNIRSRGECKPKVIVGRQFAEPTVLERFGEHARPDLVGTPKLYERGELLWEHSITYVRLQRWAERLPAELLERARRACYHDKDNVELCRIWAEALDLSDPAAAQRVEYRKFLAGKVRQAQVDGPQITEDDVSAILHEWQRRIVVWAVERRRAAVWADTGLGKTFMMIEWCRLSGEASLIVAPLAVCQQTIREAAKLGIDARFARSGDEIAGPGLWVTNYERVESIDPEFIDAVALDESSILKQSSGKTRTMLIDHFAGVPARLACSATPAPNDPEELTNQAEFLGRMLRREMLSAYFKHTQGVQGGAEKGGWRIKGHARGPLATWMSTWAVALQRPSDIGGSDDGYLLPGLKILPSYVPVPPEAAPDGHLLAIDLGGVTGRSRVRRATLAARVAEAARLVATEPDEPWLLWCGLNDEADALANAIPDAVNVHGSLDPDEKARLLLGFADGDYRVLITKPSIASMGMNFQHCARMAFVGLGDSYEQYYQCIRRCYRYGQSRVVEVHIVLSEIESQIATNVARKERQANELVQLMINHARKVHAA